MSHAELTILDCTLRDGGYYNDWDFDAALVESYLRAASDSGVDIVELGFRFLAKQKFLGPYAYTTERVINGLKIPEGLVLGVMINAGDYLKAGMDGAQVLGELFVARAHSRVGLVRIAAHVAEVKHCAPLVATLTRLGYRVGFNIMQSNGCTQEQLLELVRQIASFETVEVLYFADSLGNMDEGEVRDIVATLRQAWPGPLGFHGHDNMGKGLSNTLQAVACGVSWLDATVTGMGRGAGNTQMEYLLAELQSRQLKAVSSAPMIDLALRHFEPLKKQCGWGMNVFYYLGALNRVHPTYVQDLLTQSESFAPNDIAFLIELLGKNKGSSYRSGGVAELMSARFRQEAGQWSSASLFAQRPVVIVAGGPSARKHWPAIEAYIRAENAAVITLNLVDFVPREMITAVAACHPGRLVPFMSPDLSLPLMSPLSSLPAELLERLSHCSLLDYGMRVADAPISAQVSGCSIPAPLVAPYGICAALAGGASRIALAGFDGFDGRDERYREMNEVLLQLRRSAADTPIMSLTPTYYELAQTSVYL